MSDWDRPEQRHRKNERNYTRDDDSWRARIRGEEGSDANKLRGELYKYAFERFRDFSGLAKKNPTNVNVPRYAFEIISLADSMMNDRIQAILQTLRHHESKQWITMSSGNALTILKDEIALKKLNISDEFDELLYELGEWLKQRNISLHDFLIVNNGNQRVGTNKRVEFVIDTALWATELARDFVDESAKVIKQLKKDD